MIPPAIFFFVSFQLLAVTRELMLKRYGIDVAWTPFIKPPVMG